MDLGSQQFKLYRVYQNCGNGLLLSEVPPNSEPLRLSGVMSQWRRVFWQNKLLPDYTAARPRR
jgi:hypothetical protein